MSKAQIRPFPAMFLCTPSWKQQGLWGADRIPSWYVGGYWALPLQWLVTAAEANEFSDSKSAPTSHACACACLSLLCCWLQCERLLTARALLCAGRWKVPYEFDASITLQQAVARTFDFKTDRLWVWLGIAVNCGWIVGLNILTVFAMQLFPRTSPRAPMKPSWQQSGLAY